MYLTGVDLAKLVIRAILLMENAGGQVVGLTSDGATTNRTMWNLLGVNKIYSIIGLMINITKLCIILHVYYFNL